MQIIRVKTPRGLELKGAMWGDNSMDSVVIMMSGIMSNVFQNDLLTATGDLLEREGIALYCRACYRRLFVYWIFRL